MIKIIKNCGFDTLRNELRSGTVDTVNTVTENDKTDEPIFLSEDILCEADIMTINDFLRFDRDFIFEVLQIRR